MWDAIPDDWWLSNETCKYMLACLMHKDNKDISVKPTKLVPGWTQRKACQEKERAVADKHAKAKAERLTHSEQYGDVDHAIKKARVAGMKSHAEKIAIDTIISQVNLLQENSEFYKEIHGEERYKTMIINLLNQLPGIPNPARTDSLTQVSLTAHGSQREMELTIPGDVKISILVDE